LGGRNARGLHPSYASQTRSSFK